MTEKYKPTPPDVVFRKTTGLSRSGKGRNDQIAIEAVPREDGLVDVEELRAYIKSVEENKKLRLHKRYH